MEKARYLPVEVIPAPLVPVVEDLPHWFIIGGQAVRCFCPYRPSRDVDFGVREVASLEDLLDQLGRQAPAELLERGPRHAHLRWQGLKVSVFVLEKLADFVEDRHLSVPGILATKLHAILDRGARRDFFDLYVTLQLHRLGLIECLSALRLIFPEARNDSLLLRALTYFDDADREAALPGEGDRDWETVKEFFLDRVGQLLVPPTRALEIQARVVDARPRGAATPARRRAAPPPRPAPARRGRKPAPWSPGT